MRWLKSIWASFVEFNRGRLITNVMSYDEEDHKRNFEAVFDRAKRLSDFVGMIIRLAFVLFAATYFLTERAALQGFMRFVYFYCGLTASLLAMAMATNLVLIVLLYQSRDMPLQKSRFGRWSLLVIAIATTAVFYIGGYQLVKDVATNTLPSPPIAPIATSASP